MMHSAPKLLMLAWLLSLPLTTLAQRQQAVPVLVKETAQRVFAYLGTQPKGGVARQIADSLSRCPAGCESFGVIDRIDPAKGWQKVRERLAQFQQQATKYQQPTSTDQKLVDDLATALNNFVETSGKENVAYKKALTSADQQAIMGVVKNVLGIKPTAPAPGDEPETPPATDPPPPADAPNSLPLVPLMIGLLIGLGLGAAGLYFGLYRKKQAEASRLRQERDDARKAQQNSQNQGNKVNSPSREVEEKARKYDELATAAGNPNPLAMFQALKAEANGGDLLTLIRLAKNAPPATPPTPQSSSGTVLHAVPTPPLPTGETPPLVITPESQPPVAGPGPVIEKAETPVASSAVFYLPPPSEDGVFDAALTSPMPSSTTAYRFSPTAKNPAEATFRFDAEPNRVERLLTYRHYYLKPACDSTDELLPGQTRVLNVTDGLAVLENGGWRVTKKALIKYQ